MCVCALSHVPPSTVPRQNIICQNKAQLTETHQALLPNSFLALNKLLFRTPYWTCMPYWRNIQRSGFLATQLPGMKTITHGGGGGRRRHLVRVIWLPDFFTPPLLEGYLEPGWASSTHTQGLHGVLSEPHGASATRMAHSTAPSLLGRNNYPLNQYQLLPTAHHSVHHYPGPTMLEYC